MMHTKHSIQLQLEELGISPSDTVLVHSSMKSIGAVEGGGEAVLDALVEYVSEGLVVFPTHTWRQINAEYNVFDPRTEPSCVGALTEIFRRRSDAVRSWHPTHSVAAVGADAGPFTSAEEWFDTPCPRRGCWGKLYDRGAKVLFIGCGLRCNTLLHGVEEWYGIPNRLTDHHEPLQIRTPDGTLLDCPMRRHESPVGDISRHYGKMEGPFFATGVARRGRIGDADTVACDAIGMVDVTSAYLGRNPDLFLDDSPP